MLIYLVVALIAMSLVAACIAFAFNVRANDLDEEHFNTPDEWAKHFGWAAFYQGIAIGQIIALFLIWIFL